MDSGTPHPAESRVSDIIALLASDFVDICHDELTETMAKPDTSRHYPIHVSILDYSHKNPWMCNQIAMNPTDFIPLMDAALQQAQSLILQRNPSATELSIKPKTHARLNRVPMVDEVCLPKLPRSKDVGRLVCISGTVIRTGMVKMLETLKLYECQKCGRRFTMKSDPEQYNVIPKPVRCGGLDAFNAAGIPYCDSLKFREVAVTTGDIPDSCKDYQEIKIQEQISKLAIGTISFCALTHSTYPLEPTTCLCCSLGYPHSGHLLQWMKDDLVDSAKAGDDVTIVGIVTRRWRPFFSGIRPDPEIVLYANHVRINNEQRANAILSDERRAEFERFWDQHREYPLRGRNIILRSFCSKIFGLYVVKLAVMLVLVGGVPRQDPSGMKIRGDGHLLLVGDPGTGKSQFLRYAAKISPRVVLTTGIGSTNAGLTVTAVRDSGEWQLEAGALVLADRGLCCIDEFGSIKESDKTAIHEAMEQQTISVAKAGMVCKLNTRCSILAATNPKGKYDPNQNVTVNIAIGSPLLSRFDLVLVLIDSHNDDWDRSVSTHILDAEVSKTRESQPDATQPEPLDLWDLEKLQAYISYVKSECHPELTEESGQVLKKYYQLQRAVDLRNAARTTIRLLESLIRLAQSHARLMCQQTVTIRDAVVAVMLMEASMQTSALAGVTPTLHIPFPDDPDCDYAEYETAILIRLGLSNLAQGISLSAIFQHGTPGASQGPFAAGIRKRRRVDGDGNDDGAVDDDGDGNSQTDLLAQSRPRHSQCSPALDPDNRLSQDSRNRDEDEPLCSWSSERQPHSQQSNDDVPPEHDHVRTHIILEKSRSQTELSGSQPMSLSRHTRLGDIAGSLIDHAGHNMQNEQGNQGAPAALFSQPNPGEGADALDRMTQSHQSSQTHVEALHSQAALTNPNLPVQSRPWRGISSTSQPMQQTPSSSGDDSDAGKRWSVPLEQFKFKRIDKEAPKTS
ncbi:MCM2/3/5 family-domain-containing protein [Polychytrium aggregatum]|uniref:MCM2/3/5 family-domain-containing protein n=1 Tax=Polychytrium aggregatum TaxID=110093 RepID=UPI0022FE1157|nr:MCM2/3/5 family-domain-containing protein [Polychytrium aggregatum]KAI9207376.1 MCM2/3/5 family-domain-containing protein [Polychytrium aggregatum]